MRSICSILNLKCHRVIPFLKYWILYWKLKYTVQILLQNRDFYLSMSVDEKHVKGSCKTTLVEMILYIFLLQKTILQIWILQKLLLKWIHRTQSWWHPYHSTLKSHPKTSFHAIILFMNMLPREKWMREWIWT